MSKPKSWDSLTPEAQEAWREKLREYNRKYNAENAEKRRENDRKYKAENAEKRRENGRKYKAENAEKIKEKARKYRNKNLERNKDYQRKYYNKKAADQFFILAGAAESINNLITKNKKTE